MADRVQFILDKMAPTIKEMEKLEIFSKVHSLIFLFSFSSLSLTLSLSYFILLFISRMKFLQL